MSLELTQHHALLSTAPQACPEDMEQVEQAGFVAVMNNRPDFEHGDDQPTSASVEQQAIAHGLYFIDLPFSPSDVDGALVIRFAQLIGNAPKPILVYCRSGARSTAIYHRALQMGYLHPEDLSFIDA